MRLFYRCFPICDTLRHELTWSHYRRLISIEDEKARLWYMSEARHDVEEISRCKIRRCDYQH